MNSQRISDLLDALASGLLVTGFTLVVWDASHNTYITIASGIALGYLLVAIFWVIVPGLNGIAKVLSLIVRSMQGESSGQEDPDDPNQMLSGGRGARARRSQVGFQPTKADKKS